MRKTSIGGQALLEGIMMIGPECAAIAVRKPEFEIIQDSECTRINVTIIYHERT